MDSARPSNSKELLSLQEAAQLLGVSVQVLLAWNEHNILKPTITPDGRIVYTDHQIQQFLTIRKAASQASQFERKEHIPQAMGDWAQHTSTVQKANITSRLLYPRNSLSLVIGFGTLASMLFLFIVPLISNPKTNQQNSTGEELAKAQRSTLAISGKTPITTPVQLNNESNNAKNLRVEGENLTVDKSISQEILAKKNKTSNSDKKTTQDSIIATLLGKSNNNQQDQSEVPDESDGLSILASSGSCKDCEENSNTLAFDENGNLKGDVQEGTAISALDRISSGLKAEPIASGSSDPKIQFALLTFGALIAFYLFRRQFALSIDVPQIGGNLPYLTPFTNNEKVLEVIQKTDGAVVLTFEGKEFKISKPELYSESDQFIERLMELTRLDIKELEYDSTRDENIKLTTPLSRLVTRLGFVGIKRDLFFPRTSKQMVLFRKYITSQDLKDMNLTSNQVLKELTSSF